MLRYAIAVLAGMALFAPGCGPKLGGVEGQVTYEGEPVINGAISFLPADGNGPAEGGPIENGKYSVPDIAPGPKLVQISAVKEASRPITNAEQEAAAAKRAKGIGTDPNEPVDLIPPDAQGNNSQHEINVGQQTLDLHLKKPTGKSQ